MTHFEHNHYFIELLQDLAPELSSGELVRLRQERARDFVAEVRGWFEAQGISADVSDLKVTALGRIMMTSSPMAAEMLAELDHPEVATITVASAAPGAAASLPRSA